MSEARTTSQVPTHRRELGRSNPRSFSQHSWWRFRQHRRGILIRRIGGEPDERQAGLIEAMVTAEWHALRLEAQARGEAGKAVLETLRLAAEYRRQLLLADRDLAAATRQAQAAAQPAPQPSRTGYQGYLAQRDERHPGQ
jgi:hypothetical protein